MIKKYLNLRGSSPITKYQIEPTSIKIWFCNNKSYTYSYASAGETNVEIMKELARNGMGLSGFISRNVREMYE